GTIRFNESTEHTLAHLHEMTNFQEASRAEPWKVSDAPPTFINAMLKAIVSFEIPVTRLVGKFKSSQNRVERERNAVAEAYRAEGLAPQEVEELIREPRPRGG